MTRTWARARRAGIALVALAPLALTGCKKARQSVFAGKGESSKTINGLQTPVFYAAAVVGLIVFAAVIYVVVRFRDRPDAPIPEQSHGNPPVEIGLTAVSALILIAIGVPTAGAVFKLAKPANSDVVVHVTGQQWWWEFSYDNLPTSDGKRVVTSGELVIPTGKKVQLLLSSRDVIHSFWIPALNGKKDAVPGRVHPLRMEADQPGEYYGQCTEFCGLSHAAMRMKVVALNEADWKSWTDNQTKLLVKPSDANSAEGRGYALFSRCVACHQAEGYVDDKGQQVNAKADEQLESGAAPNLTHLMSRTSFAGANFELRAAECMSALEGATPEQFGALYLQGSTDCLNRAQLEAWLRNPSSLKAMSPDPGKDKLRRGMPNLGLTEAQIDDLIAFLKTLK